MKVAAKVKPARGSRGSMSWFAAEAAMLHMEQQWTSCSLRHSMLQMLPPTGVALSRYFKGPTDAERSCKLGPWLLKKWGDMYVKLECPMLDISSAARSWSAALGDAPALLSPQVLLHSCNVTP